MIRIINVVGARPNFMKVAPLIHEMDRHSDIEPMLVHTGQHYDESLSDVFFDELGIPRPDLNLGVGSGTRDEQIGKIEAAFEPVIRAERPDLVLVVGDVNSTIACARVAKRHDIEVAHVEAGLRSFDDTMPEERNRRETDEISDYLFVTEESGLRNLETEGVSGHVHFVGNVMIDTLVRNLGRVERSRIRSRLAVRAGCYVAATFHRPSNVDSNEALNNLVNVIEGVCERSELVLPLHPRTRLSLEQHGLLGRVSSLKNLTLCPPLGYLDFVKLVREAKAVITDSGGIQEETTYLGIPCLTMRENTERPATVTLGTNVLVGTDKEKLLSTLDEVLAGKMTTADVPPLWDGRAATRIVGILKDVLTSDISEEEMSAEREGA